MPLRDIVVIGASSGGLKALEQVVGGLPADLPAAVFVVQHLAADSPAYLPQLLQEQGPLPVELAETGGRFQHGRIYVAPPDHHLIIDAQQMYLSKGPRENRVRPAIDPLFRSAALSHGPRVAAAVLSGSLDDGTAGLQAVARRGGTSIVQDPQDALTPEMPLSALEYVAVDHCLPAAEIGPLIGRLARSEGPQWVDDDDAAETRAMQREVDIIRRESGTIGAADALGELAPVSCPECGGPMWQIEGQPPRFRCHTGHAFTGGHLVAGLEDAEEESLWVALRVMEERVRMLRRLSKEDALRGKGRSEQVFAERAAEAEDHVRRLRGLLHSRPGTPPLPGP